MRGSSPVSLHARGGVSASGGAEGGDMERLLSFFLLLTAAGRLRAGHPEFFQCTIGDFRCEDGGRVPLCRRCDGTSDCGDGSDESGCQGGSVRCGPRGRRCGPRGGPCLPLERFCDGHEDCPGGPDEAEEACGYRRTAPLRKCPKDEFRCAPDADCYPLVFVCDRHADCPDGRDELGCVFEGLSSPETPELTQLESTATSEIMPAEHWVLLAIVALLSILAVAFGVAVWVSRKAKPLLASISFDKASEQLLRKEQP